MQTRNHWVPARHNGLMPWIVMFTLGILATTGVALATAEMTLTDGDAQLDELPLGTDLYVEATGLAPFSNVDVVLLDWNGSEVLRHAHTVDGVGALPATRLWYRTGIGGCDCIKWGQGYPFRHPHEALQIIGLAVTVQLIEADSGVILADHSLTLVRSRGPLLYTSGLRGCPRERFEKDEVLMLMSTDSVSAMTVFLVPHQENWKEGDPIVDVRVGYQKGQSFQASADGLSGVLWQGIESEVGEYDLLIRPGTNQGSPAEPTFRLEDRVHSFFGWGRGDGDGPGDWRGEGGLVIDDWGCHFP